MHKIIIILSSFILFLQFLFMHNIDNSFNMLNYEMFLSKNNIDVDITDCSLVTCEKPKKIYVMSMSILTVLILAQYLLMINYIIKK